MMSKIYEKEINNPRIAKLGVEAFNLGRLAALSLP